MKKREVSGGYCDAEQCAQLGPSYVHTETDCHHMVRHSKVYLLPCALYCSCCTCALHTHAYLLKAVLRGGSATSVAHTHHNLGPIHAQSRQLCPPFSTEDGPPDEVEAAFAAYVKALLVCYPPINSEKLEKFMKRVFKRRMLWVS